MEEIQFQVNLRANKYQLRIRCGHWVKLDDSIDAEKLAVVMLKAMEDHVRASLSPKNALKPAHHD